MERVCFRSLWDGRALEAWVERVEEAAVGFSELLDKVEGIGKVAHWNGGGGEREQRIGIEISGSCGVTNGAEDDDVERLVVSAQNAPVAT